MKSLHLPVIIATGGANVDWRCRRECARRECSAPMFIFFYRFRVLLLFFSWGYINSCETTLQHNHKGSFFSFFEEDIYKLTSTIKTQQIQISMIFIEIANIPKFEDKNKREISVVWQLNI